MESLPNAAPGEWLKPLMDTVCHDMHVVVPRGFPAYARIFHPVTRDRPQDTGTWHGHPRTDVFPLDEEPVRWSAVAGAFGTKMHPLAQFHRLLGQAPSRQETFDSEGWRDPEPLTGNLAPDTLAAVAARLCEHTSTPTKGVTAIWEGWGGLTSSIGYAQVTFSDDRTPVENTSDSAALNTGPGLGLLPAEVVNGETLNLPGRAYYLFNAAPQFYRGPGCSYRRQIRNYGCLELELPDLDVDPAVVALHPGLCLPPRDPLVPAHGFLATRQLSPATVNASGMLSGDRLTVRPSMASTLRGRPACLAPLRGFRNAEPPPNEYAEGCFQGLVFERNALAPVTDSRFVAHRFDVEEVEDLGHAHLILSAGHLAGYTNWNCAEGARHPNVDGFIHWAGPSVSPGCS